jgi:hypothetical protein
VEEEKESHVLPLGSEEEHVQQHVRPASTFPVPLPGFAPVSNAELEDDQIPRYCSIYTLQVLQGWYSVRWFSQIQTSLEWVSKIIFLYENLRILRQELLTIASDSIKK